MKKRIAILGSTGSIGRNTLDVAKHLGLEVTALGAHGNIDLLEQQAREFSPKMVAVFHQQKAQELRQRLPHIQVLGGMQGLEEMAACSDAEVVVSAMSGTAGILPTIAAIRAGKDIALANKEVLVSAGELIMSLVARHQVKLLPVDSEHCALFQCLDGEEIPDVRRLVLTASGGPFRDCDHTALSHITPKQALMHPNWSMGPKITIDCSTLLNKGLEVIEAHWLFGIPYKQIEVVIHPQSLIHSMVEFVDGSLMAQMSAPDMRTPIQFALSYPARKSGLLTPFDFTKHSMLQFLQPDRAKFPCLDLAYAAGQTGGTMPAYLNAANEILVQRFLQGELSWKNIAAGLEKLLGKHQSLPKPSLEAILDVDRQARLEAASL